MTIAFTRRRQREATAEAVRQAITRGGIDVSGLVFKGLVAGCLLVVMGLLVWLFADVVERHHRHHEEDLVAQVGHLEDILQVREHERCSSGGVKAGLGQRPGLAVGTGCP